MTSRRECIFGTRNSAWKRGKKAEHKNDVTGLGSESRPAVTAVGGRYRSYRYRGAGRVCIEVRGEAQGRDAVRAICVRTRHQPACTAKYSPRVMTAPTPTSDATLFVKYG